MSNKLFEKNYETWERCALSFNIPFSILTDIRVDKKDNRVQFDFKDKETFEEFLKRVNEWLDMKRIIIEPKNDLNETLTKVYEIFCNKKDVIFYIGVYGEYYTLRLFDVSGSCEFGGFIELSNLFDMLKENNVFTMQIHNALYPSDQIEFIKSCLAFSIVDSIMKELNYNKSDVLPSKQHDFKMYVKKNLILSKEMEEDLIQMVKEIENEK